MKLMLPLVVLMCVVLLPCHAAAGAPYYVNLEGVANSGLADDGLANNGQGGWTDEGINDMLIYPPIPSGTVSRNGYHFQILDPARHKGMSLVLLRGQVRGTNYPESVTVSVPAVKGRFLYFLQNAAGQVRGMKEHDTVARYTVHYADGTEATIPMRDGIEFGQWWCGSWWDNHGAERWPVFMGCNFYSLKYNRYIGVWATQWSNTAPEKAIASLTLTSERKTMPAIFAITIDDEDYYQSPDLKADFKRPAGPPEGFFDDRTAIENKAILEGMMKIGMAQGVRRLEVIRPDLLAVTLDGVVAGGAGQGERRAQALQVPSAFRVSSTTDGRFSKGVQPLQVGRFSYNYWTGDIGSFPNNRVYWHTYYLRLPEGIRDGNAYRVEVAGLPPTVTNWPTLSYSDQTTRTPAIKVNQACYFSGSRQRYAYLGWWAGDLGAVDYAAFHRFQVREDAGQKVVYEGSIVPSLSTNTAASGETVGEMDLAALPAGRYFISVPGLGRSDSFNVGRDGMKSLYVTTMRGFLLQRCGADLTAAVTDYPRPACHLRNYENGHLVESGPPKRPGEAVREFRGGYHDAGDCDLFYQHLLAGQEVLMAFELAPGVFKDGDLNLPESGNGVPDVLDEVLWGLKFYADNQLPDGGILAGRANDEDYGRKEWKSEWASQFGELPPFGNFPPCNASANIFAAVAAHASRLLKPSDAKRASSLLVQARKAYEWGLAHQRTKYEQDGISYGRIPWKRAWLLAAAELFNTTGESRYHEDFLRLFKEGEALKFKWNEVWQMPYFYWPYASCRRPDADPDVRKATVTAIVKSAEGDLKNLHKWPYRMGTGRESGGWGNLVGGGYYANKSLMAYLLTRDQKFLDFASINADYQLGANPLSRCFITGVGARPPEHPEVGNWMYSSQGVPAPGISVFGPGGTPESMGGVYPSKVPLWRVWIDTRVDALHNEFGVTGPIGDAALLYTLFWAMENTPVSALP